MRKAFEGELERLHLLLEASPRSDLSVQITEEPSHLLLIATIAREKEEMIASVSLPKGPSWGAGRSASPLRVDRQLLWQQPEPILDLAQLEDAPGKPDLLLVLGTTSLSLFRRESDSWLLKDSAPLPRIKPFVRDLRGELRITDHFFQLHLPGVECDGDAWQKISLDCDEEAGIWRLDLRTMVPFSLDSGHNFFAVDPHYIGSEKPPLTKLFSAAEAGMSEDQGYESQMVYAGTDGKTYVYTFQAWKKQDSDLLERLPEDWGSELASVKADCRESPMLLVTAHGDRSSPDVLQAMEINRRTITPVSTAMEFPGPILTLHAEGEATATVIIRNLVTGNYEAYRVTTSCEN